MMERKQSDIPLVLMILWYALLLAGTGMLMFFGMAFGSEAYRDRGIPLIEWVIIAGPFLVCLAMLAATVWLWNAGKYKATYALCGASAISVSAVYVLAGGLVV